MGQVAEIPNHNQIRTSIAVRVMTIIGLIVSAPFILFVGMGLIAFLPLLVFLISETKFSGAIKLNTSLTKGWSVGYIVSAILSGLGSAYGFYMFWGLSHGIDVEQTPFLPFLLMVIIGCPIITLLIIFRFLRWQKGHKVNLLFAP